MNGLLLKKYFCIVGTLVAGALLWACSDGDKTAGGTSEDAGIIADLNVAGVAQKGPFVKGSEVTVRGIDCKTFKLTGERFDGVVNSDKGDFEVKNINLSSPCAIFEVAGYYLNEVSGQKSSGFVRLETITNLKGRKNVNVNVLTSLEGERAARLVLERKMSLDEAKAQAEKEVFASFGIEGDFAKADDLNIFEKGEGNVALLAVSVLLAASTDESRVYERLQRSVAEIANNGTLDDSVKTQMANWAVSAAASGKLDSIRKNIESWGFADEVPAFETYVKNFAESGHATLSSSSAGSATLSSSSIVTEWSWDVPLAARFNPNIKYDTMVDPRDNQVYKIVKIEVIDSNYSQVWMAQNLNYADTAQMPILKNQSWCYRDSAKYCEVSGRYYTWAAAIDSVALASDTVAPLDCGYGKTCEIGEQRIQGICPDGWHLPNRDEWGWLSVYLGNAGVSGDSLKALTGWDYAGTENNNGVDAYGFTALPTGRRVSDTSWSNIGSDVYYWSSQEYSANEAQYSNMNNIYTKFYLYQGAKYYGQSVRCVKD